MEFSTTAKYFHQRGVVWIISVAPETTRRLHALKIRWIELADCPERVHRGVRLKVRRQRTETFSIHPAAS
jgi:hypothetical protein